MSSLPEDDQEFLRDKKLTYELRSETLPDGSVRNCIVFPGFKHKAPLLHLENGKLVQSQECELLVIIPSGYATTRLDSFYTFPHLKRSDGADPDRATGSQIFFNKPFQFWSRHLADTEWRVGIDGLSTYLQYIRAELRKA